MRQAFVLLLLLTNCAVTQPRKSGEGRAQQPAGLTQSTAQQDSMGIATTESVEANNWPVELSEDPDAACLPGSVAFDPACDRRWGYLFLRILDEQRMPVRGGLAVRPAAARIWLQDEGFAGVLRPGRYDITAIVSGYAPVTQAVEIIASRKAFFEIQVRVKKPAAESKELP